MIFLELSQDNSLYFLLQLYLYCTKYTVYVSLIFNFQSVFIASRSFEFFLVLLCRSRCFRVPLHSMERCLWLAPHFLMIREKWFYLIVNITHRKKYAPCMYTRKKDEEYKDWEIWIWKNSWDIKVLAKLLVDVYIFPAFYSRSQPFYTFRAVPVHLTLLLFLTSTLFAPFISHLAGYCDKRITRFSPRENVFLAVHYTWKKTPDIKLKVSSRQLLLSFRLWRFQDRYVSYHKLPPLTPPLSLHCIR